MTVSMPSSGTVCKQMRETLAMGPVNTNKSTKSSCAHITVCVRKRILNVNEQRTGEFDVIESKSKSELTLYEVRKELAGGERLIPHSFVFDRVFNETSTNRDIYNSCVKSLVRRVFENGSRCSCFAFGQTGSGKTFTMLGPTSKNPLHNIPEHIGLWLQAGADCLSLLTNPQYRELELVLTFFEIHCNKAYDLLNHRKLVRPLEHSNKSVVVKDLKEVVISDMQELVYRIKAGSDTRSTGRNSKNDESSRSHGILQMIIRKKAGFQPDPQTIEGTLRRNSSVSGFIGRGSKIVEPDLCHGKLAFIDLAGSERGADSANFGRSAQQDGAGINKSLLALKECIRAMDQGKGHIPFRDSELTKILREYFTNSSSLCVMIATLAAGSSCCEQTLNTLRYANRFIAVRVNSEPCLEDDDSAVPNGLIKSYCMNLSDNSEAMTDKAVILDCEEPATPVGGEPGSNCEMPNEFTGTLAEVDTINMNASNSTREGISNPYRPTPQNGNRAVDTFKRVRGYSPEDVSRLSLTVQRPEPVSLSRKRRSTRPGEHSFTEISEEIPQISIEGEPLSPSYLKGISSELSLEQLKLVLENENGDISGPEDAMESYDCTPDLLCGMGTAEIDHLSRQVSSSTIKSYDELVQAQAMSLRDVVALSTIHIRVCRIMEQSQSLGTLNEDLDASLKAQAASIDMNSVKVCRKLLNKEIQNLQRISEFFNSFEADMEAWRAVQEEEKRRSSETVEFFE